MIIIGLLISISLTIAILFLAAFIWSLKKGQFDDTYGPSVRMLFDDKKPLQNSEKPIKLERPINIRIKHETTGKPF